MRKNNAGCSFLVPSSTHYWFRLVAIAPKCFPHKGRTTGFILSFESKNRKQASKKPKFLSCLCLCNFVLTALCQTADLQVKTVTTRSGGSSGAPQGTVLSPLWSTLCTVDSAKFCHLQKFFDNCTTERVGIYYIV